MPHDVVKGGLVGCMGCTTRMTALFRCVRSMPILTAPFGFGAITIPEHPRLALWLVRLRPLPKPVSVLLHFREKRICDLSGCVQTKGSGIAFEFDWIFLLEISQSTEKFWEFLLQVGCADAINACYQSQSCAGRTAGKATVLVCQHKYRLLSFCTLVGECGSEDTQDVEGSVTWSSEGFLCRFEFLWFRHAFSDHHDWCSRIKFEANWFAIQEDFSWPTVHVIHWVDTPQEFIVVIIWRVVCFFCEFTDRTGARTADCFVLPLFGAVCTVAGQYSLVWLSATVWALWWMLFVEWFVPVMWVFLVVMAVFRGKETIMFHKVNFAADFLPFLVGFGLTSDLNCLYQS